MTKYQEKADLLIAQLKDKSLSIKDCLVITGLDCISNGHLILNNILVHIGNNYPLYQPKNRYYKILTDKDIEDYRTQLRLEKKNARAKMG